MKPNRVIVGIAVGLAAGVIAPAAHAGFIPWGYSLPENVVIRDPNSAAALTLPNSPFQYAANDRRAVLAPVAAWSVAEPNAPDFLHDVVYHLPVTLWDVQSGHHELVSFSGVISGTFWRTGSELTNEFTGGLSRSAMIDDSVLLTVTIADFIPPAGFGDQRAGAILAEFSIAPAVASDRPLDALPVIENPEPSTIATKSLGLLCISLTAMGRARRRRRDSPVTLAMAHQVVA